MHEPATVQPDSHLTLHYRISLAETGAEVITTFDGPPATLQLGLGQLAEGLERCLIGLAEGGECSFDLTAEQAFGERNPQLLQKLARSVLTAHGDQADAFVPGDLIEFPTPNGGRFAGVLKSLDERWALFDFNHPLAGRPLRFDVRILGVL